MSQDVPPSAAILEPEQHARYQKAVAFLEQQIGLAERARLWRELYEAHGLDPETEYSVDWAGRVFDTNV